MTPQYFIAPLPQAHIDIDIFQGTCNCIHVFVGVCLGVRLSLSQCLSAAWLSLLKQSHAPTPSLRFFFVCFCTELIAEYIPSLRIHFHAVGLMFQVFIKWSAKPPCCPFNCLCSFRWPFRSNPRHTRAHPHTHTHTRPCARSLSPLQVHDGLCERATRKRHHCCVGCSPC